jgi:toxin YoeB
LRVHFTDHGWDDYLYWCQHDAQTHERLNELIENIRRTAFTGIGKPERLKGDYAGFWSRRITGEHRLVYTVEGKGRGPMRHHRAVPVPLLNIHRKGVTYA